MSTFGWWLLTLFFAALAWDASRFRGSATHRVWAVLPFKRERGVDPLTSSQQQRWQRNDRTGAGGVPGLHWVFAGLTIGSAAAAIWSSLG